MPFTSADHPRHRHATHIDARQAMIGYLSEESGTHRQCAMDMFLVALCEAVERVQTHSIACGGRRPVQLGDLMVHVGLTMEMGQRSVKQVHKHLLGTIKNARESKTNIPEVLVGFGIIAGGVSVGTDRSDHVETIMRPVVTAATAALQSGPNKMAGCLRMYGSQEWDGKHGAVAVTKGVMQVPINGTHRHHSVTTVQELHALHEDLVFEALRLVDGRVDGTSVTRGKPELCHHVENSGLMSAHKVGIQQLDLAFHRGPLPASQSILFRNTSYVKITIPWAAHKELFPSLHTPDDD